VTEINGQTYGPLKVACEQIVREIYSGACTLLRPQIVVGPFDPERRYPYWAERAASEGPVLAPGDGSAPFQLIDVRDVARFAVRAAAHRLSGAFNLAGPALTWAGFLQAAGARQVRWTDDALFQQHAPDAEELSLYVPPNALYAGRMQVSAARALAAGLTLTGPAVTAQDTRAWSQPLCLPYTLTPTVERQLLKLLKEVDNLFH